MAGGEKGRDTSRSRLEQARASPSRRSERALLLPVVCFPRRSGLNMGRRELISGASARTELYAAMMSRRYSKKKLVSSVSWTKRHLNL